MRVQGTIRFGPDQQERNLGRTSTIEIKAVGIAQVVAPGRGEEETRLLKSFAGPVKIAGSERRQTVLART